MFNFFNRGPLRAASAGVEAMIAADLGGGGAPSQGATETSSPSPEPASTPAAQPETQTSTESQEPFDDDFELNLDSDPDTGTETDVKAAEPPPQAEVPELKDDKTDPDSEVGKLLATSRGRRIYASFKKDQMLAEPEGEDGQGGIGFSPSVEQVKQFYRDSHDLSLMQHHFDSGQPASIEEFAKFWFAPQQDGKPRPGASVFANAMPDMLQKINPELNIAVARNYVNRYVNVAVDRMLEAASSQDVSTEAGVQKQKELYLAAQHMHRDAYGQWFDPKARTARTKGPEPVSAELAALNQLRSQVASERKADFQSRWDNFRNTTDNSIDRALNYDVDQALKAVKEHYKDAPLVYEGIRDRLVREVQQAVAKNRDGMGRFQLRYDQSQSGMNQDDIKELTRMYRQMAAQVIMSKRPEYLKAAAVSLKQQSDANHGKLREASAKKNVTAAGQPAAQDIRAALPQKKPGESHAEFMNRLVGAGMGQPA